MGYLIFLIVSSVFILMFYVQYREMIWKETKRDRDEYWRKQWTEFNEEMKPKETPDGR